MGSISVTMTRAPAALNDAAVPLPTSPYPAQTTTLPAIIKSVARRMASTADSRQPYLLSNLLLVTRVVHVDSRHGQGAFDHALVQTVYPRGRLFGQAADTRSQFGVAIQDHVGQVSSIVQNHI